MLERLLLPYNTKQEGKFRAFENGDMYVPVYVEEERTNRLDNLLMSVKENAQRRLLTSLCQKFWRSAVHPL
jgi:hypothetical protein